MGRTGFTRQLVLAFIATVVAVLGTTVVMGTAVAQSPAETQYGAPDIPAAGDVESDTATGVTEDGAEALGDDASGTDGTTATPGASTPGAAGSAPAGEAGAGAAEVARATLLQFGPASTELEADISAAIERAGLVGEIEPTTDPDALGTFLDSELADRFGDDARAVGQALGAQLVSGTPLAAQAFEAIFGDDPPFTPVERAVLTQSADLDDDEAAFLEGLATGLRSTDIPLAFVEREDEKPSHAKTFADLDVLTVTNVDTEDGKADLAAILVGEVTTQEQVEIDRASAVIGDDGGSTGAVPWVVLALLAGGGVVLVRGGLRAAARR